MDRPPSRGSSLLQRTQVIAVLAAVAAAGWLLWARHPSEVEGPTSAAGASPASPSVSSADAASSVSPDPAQAQAADAPAASDGLTPQEWAQLRQSLAGTPDADTELPRIARWLVFQRRGQRFQEALRRQDHGTDTQALARQIDSEIGLHLAQGELSGGEALALKSAVLTELEPDAQARTQALTRWRQTQIDQTPASTDPRDAIYLAAQAEVLTQWRAQAGQASDPATLQARLSRERERIYGQSPPSP